MGHFKVWHKMMMKRPGITVFILAAIMGLAGVALAEEDPIQDRVVLADFSQYPDAWRVKGEQSKADDIYEPVLEGEGNYLRARVGEESVRIFKKIEWDPNEYPYIEWRWRVKKWPETGPARIFMYVSLDKDFFGIPILIKYAWARDEEEGSSKKGGFFRPAEVVIRSGTTGPEDWMIERIHALDDFQKFIGRGPKERAYGIGILVEPGIEVDIGEISAHRKGSEP